MMRYYLTVGSFVCKKASLYSHYSGKESIFTAVFNNILADYSRFIDDLTVSDAKTNTLDKLTVGAEVVCYNQLRTRNHASMRVGYLRLALFRQGTL